MFDREVYRKGLQMAMTDPDMIEKELDKLEYRHRNLKKGDKVIQLSYSGSVIPEQDILDFEKDLNAVGYQLSYIDGDGEIRADFFEITNLISFEFVAGATLGGIIGGYAHEIVKKFTQSTFKYCKKQLTSRLQSGTVTKHQPTTAIVVYHGEHKSIVYIFPNDLPSKTVGKAIDSLSVATVKHSQKYGDKDAYYEHYKLQKNAQRNLLTTSLRIL